MTKLTAKQKKEVEKRFLAIRRGDKLVTMTELINEEFAAADKDYGSDEHRIIEALYQKCQEWVQESRKQYERIGADVERIAREYREESGTTDYVYLWDEAVDHENVCVEGVTEESVCYWSRMVFAGGCAAGDRSGEYDIDINARLGYSIF